MPLDKQLVMQMNSVIEESLRISIRSMTNRDRLYKLLKEELSARGWWKNRARGKPRGFKPKGD